MNKKRIKHLIMGIALLTVGTLVISLTKRLIKIKDVKEKQLSLSLEDLDFFNQHLSKDTNKILALFHPNCDFCQVDAIKFYEDRVSLKNLDVLWISYDDKDSIQKFAEVYGLDTLPNIHFAYMDIEAMLERYGNVKFPTFLAYDKSGELIKKWVGLTQPQEILDAYNQEE